MLPLLPALALQSAPPLVVPDCRLVGFERPSPLAASAAILPFVSPMLMQPPVGAVSPIPQFVAVGTIPNVQGTSLAPSYPAGIQNGDVAILTVLITDSSSSPGGQTVTTADGTWTLIQAIPRTTIPSLVDAYGVQYWKRCDGTETGTVTVNFSETNNTGTSFACISVWRGCVASGTPVEAATFQVESARTNPVSSSITTLGTNRRVLAHFMTASTLTTVTANSPAVEHYTDSHNTSGIDSDFGGYSVEAPTAGSYSVGLTLAAARGDMSATLALIGT